jgi:predicted nucleic acid-binding protein/GNAT superfamily N-acetyltransferase
MKNNINVQIEYIDQSHRFFKDVISLGSKYSSTLGFMPKGGFIEHAHKKCIIIAHNDSELIGYLMFRIVSYSLKISIVHLCVKENFRRQNIPTILLDSLIERYKSTLSGISLWCRNDYSSATTLWQKYGFIYKAKKRSRSIEENYLYLWWYDFNNPDLFSYTQEISTKIRALLDTNIIVKLRDNQIDQNLSRDPRPLLAGWLTDEVDYCYASELLNEIIRDKNTEREEKTRLFLKNFEEIRTSIENCKKIANELNSIITGNSDNDKSDRMQLATAIASKTPYFITFDNEILDKKEIIDGQYSLQIFTPHEFVIEVDQLLNKEDYSPSKLKGVTFHSIGKVPNTELDKYIDMFLDKANSEKKVAFQNIVYANASHIKVYNINVIKQDKKAIAFFSYKYEDTTLIITFIRLLDSNQKQTLFMQLITDFINKAINKKLSKIIMKEKHISDSHKLILERLGFSYCSSSWIKHLYDRIIEKSQLLELDCNLSKDSITEILKEENEYKMKNILLSIEHKFFPLKISDLDIPCYIIPIKPYWAGQLFDMHISGSTLFGAVPDKLWNIENVYYRHVKPITEIAPARILWYASSGKTINRSRAIIATSYLDEVMTGSPKLLFRRNKHYGVYEWSNIYDLCEKDIEKNIRALRFSRTEVFDNPVRLSIIRKIFKNNGKKENTFTSPVKIDNDIFIQVYKIGIESDE